MEQRYWLARCALSVGLALLVGCTTSKTSVTRLVLKPEPAIVSVSAPADLGPPLKEEQPPVFVPPPPPLEEQIDLLIINARAAVDTGKELFHSGKIEEGRRQFKHALDSLKTSGITFFENPRLEQAYYTLLNEIQAEELRVMVDPSQIRPPEFDESTPLDEISDLNLYSIIVDPRLEKVVSQDLLETRFDIPVVVNDQVLRFLDFYQNRGRRIMETGLRRSGRYLEIFRSTFQKEGVPLDLAYIAHVESLFNPKARSRAKAIGLWQFMKGTGLLYNLRQDWWLDERSDIQKSTLAAARYLKDLYATFNDWHLALAAYNVGPGRIERIVARRGTADYWTMAEKRLLPRETTNYVPSVLAALIIFRHPARYGFGDVVPDAPLEFDEVPLEFQVDLRVVAEKLGTTVEDLQELNPELRWGVTPDARDYVLKVPVGHGEGLARQLSELPANERLRFAHHKVRKGDTLGAIARKFGTTVEAIVRMNRLKSARSLRISQDLVIPGRGWKRDAASVSPPETENQAPRVAHVVRRGESLSKIAQRYGVRVDELVRCNNLRRGQRIFPGQTLRLPKRAESRSASNQSENTQ